MVSPTHSRLPVLDALHLACAERAEARWFVTCDARLLSAAERLGDPQLRRIPVVTIALEVGYGSVGPFNRAFKERFGMTPTEYRRHNQAPHAPFPESA